MPLNLDLLPTKPSKTKLGIGGRLNFDLLPNKPIEPEEEGLGEYARKTLTPTPRSVLGLAKGGAGMIGRLMFPTARQQIETLIPETRRAEAITGMVAAPTIAAIGAVEAGAAPVLKRYIRGEPAPEIRRKALPDITKGIIDNLAVLLGTKEKALTLGEVATEAAPEKLGPFKLDTSERKAVFGQMVEALPYLAATPGMVRGILKPLKKPVVETVKFTGRTVTKAGKETIELGKGAIDTIQRGIQEGREWTDLQKTFRQQYEPKVGKVEVGRALKELKSVYDDMVSGRAISPDYAFRKLFPGVKEPAVFGEQLPEAKVTRIEPKPELPAIPREKALTIVEQKLSERMAPKVAIPTQPIAGGRPSKGNVYRIGKYSFPADKFYEYVDFVRKIRDKKISPELAEEMEQKRSNMHFELSSEVVYGQVDFSKLEQKRYEQEALKRFKVSYKNLPKEMKGEIEGDIEDELRGKYFDEEATIRDLIEQETDAILKEPPAGGQIPRGPFISPQEKAQVDKLNITQQGGVNLDRDIVVKDVFGREKKFKKGESIFIYRDEKTGKALVKDGDYGVLQGGQVSKVEQAGAKWGGITSEEPQVEEVVKSANISLPNFTQWMKERGYAQVEAEEMWNRRTPEYFEYQKQNLEDLGKVTKFSQYQLPGGENYREVALKLPTHPVESDPSHFDDAAAWARVNDRTYKRKNDTLFVEEIQKNKNLDKTEGHPWTKGRYVGVLWKRLIKEAIEGGYDYISWTTGEQQAERYDLSKQVDSIEYTKRPNGEIYLDIFTKGTTGGVVSNPVITNVKDITSIIGKEPAEKIIKATYPINKDKEIIGRLTEENLKIGGEWAKNLYDRQTPNILKDLTKGEVIKLDIGRRGIYDVKQVKGGWSVIDVKTGGVVSNKVFPTRNAAQKDLFELSKEALSQPALKITPEMRARVLGQPIGGGITRKITAEDLTDDVLERLPLYSRQVLTRRIIEGKSYEQTLKEVGAMGDTIEDIKQRENEAIADVRRIQQDIESGRIAERKFEEEFISKETRARQVKIKEYFKTNKLKAELREQGEYDNLRLIPEIFAKEGERGTTPDDMIEELNAFYNLDLKSDDDVLDLLEDIYSDQIKQRARKAVAREEVTFVRQQKAAIERGARFTGRKQEKPPKRQEIGVGTGSIINTRQDIDGAERNRILSNMPIWLAGNKAEVLSRLSPQLKVELTKGIEEVYDLFGGAKGYRVGLFDKIAGEKYHLNEFSDERYNLYNNLKDPQKMAVIKQTVVNLRDELIREIADAFGIDPNIYNPEALRNALNKWLQRGLHKERYDFARKAIQAFGERLLQEAEVDNFKSPESSAKYYFLQNTSIFGINKTAKGYEWTQGIIRTSADKSSIRDTMGRVVNVDTLLTNELSRDKNISLTQEDAWGMMDKITQNIKVGKIAPEKTAVLIDPQYLNPTQKEGTYAVGQEDATWEGHKKNLEQHLLPLYNTGIKIIYTNNEDINLTKWLRSHGLPYNVEERVGVVAEKGGRDEIISFANYQLPTEYTARVSPVAGRLQPGQYVPEEITGESPRFTEYLRQRYAGEQEARQKQVLIEKIKDIKAQKMLSNATISRLKQYFNIREMKNARLPVLQDLIDYLETFVKEDAFLSEKQFAALYDIIKEIPNVAITPKRIIFDKLGAQKEILSTGLSGKIPFEMFPTVDIKEGHPIVRNIIDRIEIRMNQAEQEIARRDKQFEQMIRKAEQARAGQIRVSERLRRAIVPQNIEIFRALGGDRVFLEKEEVAVVAYLKNFFKKVRDDLQLEKYRKRYVTHLEQTLSEKILTQGLMPAVADIFQLRRKETIPIDIFLELDNIIGSEKFFRFALPRTGGVVPTTDLRRIVHAYSSLYETKKALDETLPEGQAIVKTLLQPQTAQWMKRYLQNLKGRGLDFNFRTGRMGWLPKVADQIVDLGYLKLLGLNYWSALKNLVAGEANSFIYQPFKNFLTGKQRLIANPKKAIKMAQENFVLEGTYADYAQQGIKKLRKVRDLFMIGQKAGEYEIRTSLFIGELTDKEWETGEIDPQHLQRIKDIIAITQGIFSKTQSPLWMQTWYGRMFMQMNRWRATNAMLVRRLIKEKNYKGLSKAFILYGIGMYISYQLAKAGYKKAAKVAQASAETINSIIEAVTLKPIYDAITDNPTLSVLGELVYTIQEVANYIGVPGIEEPRKIEFKRGIEKTWISPVERTKELFGIQTKEQPRPKLTPRFTGPSKLAPRFTGRRF